MLILTNFFWVGLQITTQAKLFGFNVNDQHGEHVTLFGVAVTFAALMPSDYHHGKHTNHAHDHDSMEPAGADMRDFIVISSTFVPPPLSSFSLSLSLSLSIAMPLIDLVASFFTNKQRRPIAPTVPPTR